MDIKFNSLFDNDNFTQSDTDQRLIDSIDESLIINNLILQADEQKKAGIKLLEDRQFGDQPVRLLSGRPCSTSLCSSGKFCESAGWPEMRIFKRADPCSIPIAPNSSRGDPDIYLNNIEIEAKLKNIDYLDSKCQLKNPKNDSCSKNPDRCALRCHKNAIMADYQLPGMNRLDTDGDGSFPLLSDGIKRVQRAQANFCRKIPNKFNEASLMRTNMPTRRRDTINW